MSFLFSQLVSNMSSDECDEAPEDISFSTGKANAQRDLDIAKSERKKSVCESVNLCLCLLNEFL